MQNEPMPNTMESFDDILDHLRDAHGKPLTDTSTFFVTAALLTIAAELAGVREQLGWLGEDAAIIQFNDLPDAEDFDE